MMIQISKFLKDGCLPEEAQLWEESQTLEYKRCQYPFSLEKLNQIYNLYSAWLNTTGGVLFLGVLDRFSTVEGIYLNKAELAISKELLSIEKANIVPPPPADCFRLTFIPVKSTESKERYVIRIEIKHGDKMTYYGRDTGYFNYIRMPQFNEKENKFEKVQLKLNHLQRLEEDANNLNNQPEFEFDNSYEFPNISLEKPSEEVLKKAQEIQRNSMGYKLQNVLEKRATQGSFGYLNNLSGSIENPNIYHAQNIWSGLKGIEELQDSVIRKLEKMVSQVGVEQKIIKEEKSTIEIATVKNNASPFQNIAKKSQVEETKINNILEKKVAAPENSLALEKIEQLVIAPPQNNLPSSQQKMPTVVEEEKKREEPPSSLPKESLPINEKSNPKRRRKKNKNKYPKEINEGALSNNHIPPVPKTPESNQPLNQNNHSAPGNKKNKKKHHNPNSNANPKNENLQTTSNH